MKHEVQILVIDLGSQYTLVIGRTLRELGLRSAILPPSKAEKWLKQNQPKAIILSGGNFSVNDEGAPVPPLEILEVNVPILGICYGMQWMVKHLGGVISNQTANREYGLTEVILQAANPLFQGVDDVEQVWSSHGDSASQLPECFKQIGWSDKDDDNNGATIVAIQHTEKPMWGVQFHPEVNETPEGKKILSNFLFYIAKCEQDWEPADMIQHIRNKTVASAPKGKRIVLGMSGGVDSTTTGAMLSPIYGDNLLGIVIDHGGLREGELEIIKRNAALAGVKIKIIDAVKRFQEALGDSIDAEVIRACFRKIYAEILSEEAITFDADYILQGSLATDFIESGARGEAIKIKTHHNIGLELSRPQLHPLEDLFKYEVRELALTLGLPEEIAYCHPFPGPGLYIRTPGVPATLEILEIARWANTIATRILKEEKIYDGLSQLVVGLWGLKTTGVAGDERKYEFSAVVRAVITADFMTAQGVYFEERVFRKINREIVKHPRIVRCLLDPTDKPPATTEFQGLL